MLPIYTEDLYGDRVERSEKINFFLTHTKSRGVRIEDKPKNCKEPCLEQSDLFSTTQTRIKTTKCNNFPLSNPYFMIIPHSKTLEKWNCQKSLVVPFSFPWPPPGDKQTNPC